MSSSAINVSPQRLNEAFFAATALIGTGLIIAGTTRWCDMARLVAVLPWNRNGNCAEQAA